MMYPTCLTVFVAMSKITTTIPMIKYVIDLVLLEIQVISRIVLASLMYLMGMFVADVLILQMTVHMNCT